MNSQSITHRDDERNGADHLQDERDPQHLLPHVALETQAGQEAVKGHRVGEGGSGNLVYIPENLEAMNQTRIRTWRP